MIEYTVSSLIFGAIGALVGFYLGRVTRNGMRSDPAHDVVPTRAGGVHAQRVVGALLIVVAAGSVVLGSITNVRLNSQTDRLSRVTECQSGYNRAYAAGLKERVDAAAVDREAQRKLLIGLQTTGGELPPEQRQAVLEDFLAQGRAADQQRATSPLPTETCG